MVEPDPIRLIFGGMAKLAPGSDADTRQILGALPVRPYRRVVDAGCGTGRQTRVLVEALATTVHAVDSNESFLDELLERARAAGVADRIEVHRMDMREIPRVFRDLDLIWSEGSAYAIGFSNALAIWSSALAPAGILVASELSWLNDRSPNDRSPDERTPSEVAEFFRTAYPAMRSIAANIEVAEEAGYEVLATHVVPESAWVDGYYDVLGPRSEKLLDHPDSVVRELARGTLREIEVFERSQGSYGYVFYVLRFGVRDRVGHRGMDRG